MTGLHGIRWLSKFGRLSRSEERSYDASVKVPDGTRVYAVGDIHGCATLLDQLHGKIAADADGFSGQKYIVYLGDYVDRGPDSKGVIDRLLDEPVRGTIPKFLKGNHDATLLQFLEDAEIYRSWRTFGAPPTLMSYGVRPPLFESPAEFEEARLALSRTLPRRHREFLEALETIWVFGDYAFVHAGLRPGIPIAEQREKDMLWIRSEFYASSKPFEKCVVHGHSASAKPRHAGNRIAVDTGAYATGQLSCAVLEGTACRFLQASPKN